ncbi:MAG TPA: hypothetical protein VIJ66_13115 [Solirubrobacteraceae bacterium]
MQTGRKKVRGASGRSRRRHTRPGLRPISVAGMVILALGAGLLAAGAFAAVSTGTSGETARGGPGAHAARTLNGTDTAHLHLVHQRETVVIEEGAATGALPGSMRAQLDVGSVFTGTCTISTHGGTVTGHGRAIPRGSGRYQSFSGTLTITGGSGRYAHARGSTGLYGTFDRRTFALVIQTSGRIAY